MTWFEAFDALEEYLETLPRDRKKVVFIDEMPWIDRIHSNFVLAFEGFWNGWAMSRGDIMLIATGSATSWMRDKLIENKGGLHSRITSQLHIAPFTLGETERYLENMGITWDRYQILQSYMALGGVPFYYSILDPELSLSQNIDRLFFKPDGKLKDEFNELEDETKYEGGQLTKILKNLERCDFIERWSQYGNKKREEVLRLTDFYTLFYYKFIDSRNIREEQWWCKNTAVESSYSARTFFIQ